MKKIYFSTSILGAAEADADLPEKLVSFMIESGFDVVSKHVALPSNFISAAGVKMKLPAPVAAKAADMTETEICQEIRDFDTKGVDASDYIITLINAPAHGVGMELERALLRPERGLSPAKILCLASANPAPRISGMIRGINPAQFPHFQLSLYKDAADAKRIVELFLSSVS